MNMQFTEETIRVAIGEMLSSDFFKGFNIKSNRDQIIATLWNWVSDVDWGPINNPQRILVLLQDIYGDIPMEVEVQGTIFQTKYLKLYLPNSTWYITNNGVSYMISSTLPMNGIAFNDSQKTAEQIRIFDQAMPKIRDWIEETFDQIEKDRTVSKIITTTAKALVEKVKNEERINLPEVLSVNGSKDGSITIYFKDETTINCTLETLRDKILQLQARIQGSFND